MRGLSYAEAAELLFSQGEPGFSESVPRPMRDEELAALPPVPDRPSMEFEHAVDPYGDTARYVADFVLQNPLGNAITQGADSYLTGIREGQPEVEAVKAGLRGGIEEFHSSFAGGLNPFTPTPPHKSFRDVEGMEDVPGWQIGLMDAVVGGIGPALAHRMGVTAAKGARAVLGDQVPGGVKQAGLTGRFTYEDMALRRARQGRETPTHRLREQGRSTSGNLDDVYRDTMQMIYDTADDQLRHLLTTDRHANQMIQGMVREVHRGVTHAVKLRDPGDLQNLYRQLMTRFTKDMGLHQNVAHGVSREIINRSQQARRLFNQDQVTQILARAGEGFSRLAGVRAPITMKAPLFPPRVTKFNRRELDQHLSDLHEANRMASMAQEGRTPLTMSEILQEAQRRVREARGTITVPGGQ